MSASPGERGCLGVGGCGREQPKMDIPGSALGGPAPLRALSPDSCDWARCTLGEQAHFWSCGAPWHASNPSAKHLEALTPPSAKAAGPWRQGSVTSSSLSLSPCPRQVFLWEPGRLALGAKAQCAVAVALLLLLKGWGQKRARAWRAMRIWLFRKPVSKWSLTSSFSLRGQTAD